jgi:hypothetical protein
VWNSKYIRLSDSEGFLRAIQLLLSPVEVVFQSRGNNDSNYFSAAFITQDFLFVIYLIHGQNHEYGYNVDAQIEYGQVNY